MKTEELEAAIDGAQRWLNYLERQKQDTKTLQKAASLARKGDAVGAKKLKSQVDSQPRVYDGATLLPSVVTLMQAARHYLDLLPLLEKEPIPLQAKCERYERALKSIESYDGSLWVQNHTVSRMADIAREALQEKTDEQ